MGGFLMAKKSEKLVISKFKIPEGSHAINPFYFELIDLNRLVEECQNRKFHSLAISLRKIHDDISEKRNSYKWIEPK